MKLTVIGGGGVRSPFLAKSLVEKAKELRINEIVFMDNNEKKLNIYGVLAKKLSEIIDKDVKFTLTTSIEEAVKDADFIITTIRAGEDMGRVHDERIALKNGVLGQETTGAGGFAMALRSIPVLKEYLEVIKKLSKPNALVFNFTNPSGLVAQALRSEGYNNVYGICDGPSEFIKEIESMLNVPLGSLDATCYGLNHLSWFKDFKLNNEDITEKLLQDDKLYKETEMRFFDKDLANYYKRLFNGYLYYYYSREKSVENILKSEFTRGETIKNINEEMHKELEKIDIENNFEKAFEIYVHFYSKREASYMAIESGTSRTHIRKMDLQSLLAEKNDDGYAGVALRFIDAFVNNKESKMILIVPNEGAIEGLSNEDTVEVTCVINKDGAKPIKIGKVLDLEMNLISQIKLFERLTAKAIKEKSIEKANIALSIHPLVNSYSLAKKLVGEYLEAHKEFVGEWS